MAVMVPKQRQRILVDWDLWGPMILAMALALSLRSTARSGQQELVFTGVFVRAVRARVWVRADGRAGHY